MDRYLRMENETRGAGGERAHRATGSGTRSRPDPLRGWLAVMGRSVSMRADPRIAPGCGGMKAAAASPPPPSPPLPPPPTPPPGPLGRHAAARGGGGREREGRFFVRLVRGEERGGSGAARWQPR